ncbi:MAG TPA: efflux RND transporter periplasmic adaptor subunit [Elusimicrobiota bacterium]|nr:efflux RND transporter periplasmic adaptor subunit [Elusimicrobiota bacterium]HMZ26277.1 efflux RND transporter periplasmic adaptor subunit [Elusimicrobiota bacterium]HNA60161.1 efflux RND transporter periplasmic adaptor subunit [Elusimicrobiota bacterium]HNF58287.1 efflux RND transporter periplasmic adaptor subunit [Elusimicrobiota bacterium]HNG44617.1 efflux RND transporter periplasmic adaptor subunit [Elusimicrobiota bacterium]
MTAPANLQRRWPLAAAVAGILGAAWGIKKFQERRLYEREADAAAQAAREVPQVKAYKVRPQNVAGALKRIGTIRARAETNLQFGAPGRISRFTVEKGQFVKKGALLAALDQAEAKNALDVAQLEYEKAAVKYFKDQTIDRLTYEQAKARYKQAQLEADKTTIRAAHDGYLVEKWVNEGEHADPGTVIGKLMDKSRVFIEMDLSEDDIQHLKPGQKVAVTVDAVPDFKEDGTVLSVTPYLKGDTRSFGVKVDLPANPQEKLSPGMFARCTVRRYEKVGALTVPLEAGAEMQQKTMRLFVVDEKNAAHARTADILFMDEGIVEVSGVTEGELVILNPGTDLEDGATVRVMDVFDPAAHTESPVAPG